MLYYLQIIHSLSINLSSIFDSSIDKIAVIKLLFQAVDLYGLYKKKSQIKGVYQKQLVTFMLISQSLKEQMSIILSLTFNQILQLVIYGYIIQVKHIQQFKD
ncbi:unnamed protein product [Paramecium octaurelia]|uniref:Transmembrane protein n=1 Tax=Paramecium octaurelia TaxID=43137 RepID=A0A8S1TLV3_PAROT|nr:unnamed protein product [Paramecium octaurelia]